ncbi:CRISPR-associated endonuclease/helicase Cas3 [Camelimonas lactis]|uniref:CRISPR-associated endonuclease/helicase Cas3 n=2 Tax=Camelimonas lactis TaxID=659006 RepID=A0A4R2GKH2_9HYPH|nr:CRISPR-associated endonuclease/helicase Cas3 [Camelimonas lactis]
MGPEVYFAHSSPNPDMTDWETCPVHSHAVGDMAGAFAGKFGASRLARLTGQMHDLGKYTREFQQYIRGARAKGPDHSTAGAREIISLATAPQDRLFASIAAYAIAGHHAGLPDHGLEDGCLEGRLARNDLPALFPGWRDALTAEARQLAPEGFSPYPGPAKKRAVFQAAFLGRMLFSCLVDADRLCTEAYYAGLKAEPVDRSWPRLPEIAGDLVAAFDAYMEEKAASMPEAARAAPLNQLRNAILAQVRSRATMPKGVFTLDVPTGGGKTLSSLAFALEHARHHGMDRIVFGIPFTSIVEQTAGIMRAVFGDDDSRPVVLEHHSGFDAPPASEEGEQVDLGGVNKRRLAMENWAAPLVVTTNVQLFESLFSARPARCRKLHNLCNAVIVLDEAQSIPLNLLRPCVAALDELVRNYGCTVVLCTATQPALLAPDFLGGFKQVTELAPNPDALHAELKRVTPRLRGALTDAELVQELAGSPQGLVIVNNRAHARALYLAAKEAGLEGLVHLTTRQTAAHRRRILADVRRLLKAGEPCRVIATSLIEAGVDVSFPRVWRAETGLDSIIQAAGRCNREGERLASESFVDVFTPAEVKSPPAIQQLAAAFGRAASEQADFFARDVITLYFREVYWGKGDGLDQVKVKNRDGRNQNAAVADLFGISNARPAFGYRTCGEAFRFIEDGMAPVIIVQEDEPREAIAALRAGAPVGGQARKLQSWIVQIPPRYRKLLIENGHARFLEGFGEQFAVLTRDDLYSPEEGLVWELADSMGLEQYIF